MKILKKFKLLFGTSVPLLYICGTIVPIKKCESWSWWKL